MVLRKKSLLAGIIVTLLILGIGIYRSTRAEITTSDAGENLIVNADTQLEPLAPDGTVVKMTLWQQALYAGGQEIQAANASVTYEASGREIDWNTFKINIVMKLTIREFKGKELLETFIDNKVIKNETLNTRTGTVREQINLKEEIAPYVTSLENGSTVVFTVRYFIKAEANDTYGVLRVTSPALASRSLSTTWVEPELNVETDVPDEESAIETAYQEGYKKGLNDGRSKGCKDGYNRMPFDPVPPEVPDSPYVEPELDEAWKDGYKDGYDEGYRIGYRVCIHHTRTFRPSMTMYSTAFEISVADQIFVYSCLAVAAGILTWYLTKRFLGW